MCRSKPTNAFRVRRVMATSLRLLVMPANDDIIHDNSQIVKSLMLLSTFLGNSLGGVDRQEDTRLIYYEFSIDRQQYRVL